MQPIVDPTTHASLRDAVTQMHDDYETFLEAVAALRQAQMERAYTQPVRWRRLRTISYAIVYTRQWLCRRVFRHGKDHDSSGKPSALDARHTDNITHERS